MEKTIELEKQISALEARKDELTSELDSANASLGQEETARTAAILKDGKYPGNVKKIQDLRDMVTSHRSALALAEEQLYPLRHELALLAQADELAREKASPARPSFFGLRGQNTGKI